MTVWKLSDYSAWSRMIARNTEKKEILKEISKLDGNRLQLSKSHLRAIEKTSSMESNSRRRAQSRNSMIGNYEKLQAYKNALEILENFSNDEICADEKN